MQLSARIRAGAALLALCGVACLVFCAPVQAVEEPSHSQALDDAIIAAAKRHGVPEHLVRRIIMRESKYNAQAHNRSFWGLMQISYPTARSMGFKGTPQELLNPVVNLRYAVPYLANAFVIAGKREDAAVRLYAAGYYFTARTRGLLSDLRTADSHPLNGIADDPQTMLEANAVAPAPQSIGGFGALFSPGSSPQPQVAAYTADATAQAVPSDPGQGLMATSSAAFNGPTVAMVADKKGALAPPKKWTRDGGMTIIARGEQVADGVRTASGEAKSTKRRSRKITLAAVLDVPPSSAQAYAGAPAQDPAFATAPSQTAILQATSGQAPADSAGPSAVASQVGAPQVAQAEPAADVGKAKPTRRKRPRSARHHHRESSETQVAESKPGSQTAPAATPTTAEQ